MKQRWALLVLSFVLGCAGCHKRVPGVRPPGPGKPPAAVQATPEGLWQTTTRDGKTMKMNFMPNGRLEFQNGFGFYNPAHWDFDPMKKLLYVTMPYTPDEKLQIFKLYVGDGVKAVDRERKQITYDFTSQTDTLNIGGWLYTKAEHGAVNVPVEPTLK
jgi:hypothetical protein